MHTILLLASLTLGDAVPGPVRIDYVTMPQCADPTVRQALAILAQPVSPIELVTREEAQEIYRRTPGARALTPELAEGLKAFRVAHDHRIFVNRDSALFREVARRPTPLALLKLAAILAHEEVHGSDGEYAASRLQADFVRSRLHTLPRRERTDARLHLRDLEARTTALARGARRAWQAQARLARPTHPPDSPRGTGTVAALSPQSGGRRAITR